MMNIGLDMMGGDYAPLEALKGIALFREANPNAQLTLFGDTDEIQRLIAEHNIDASNCSIVPTTQVIDMHEHPTKAMREKPDSSISIGFKYLATGKVDAFISAGNTGAMMVGSLFSIKAIAGKNQNCR